MKNNIIANLAKKVINRYKEYLKNDYKYFSQFINYNYNKFNDIIDENDYNTLNKVNNYINEYYDVIDIVTYDEKKEINTISLEEILSMLNDESYEYYYFIKDNKIYYGYQKHYSKIYEK